MAIARVLGPTAAFHASAQVTATFASTPTQGNLLIAIGFGNTVATNASISGWTKSTSARGGSAKWQAMFYKVAGASESADVVLDWTSSTLTTIVIEEWGGFTGTPTLDKTAYEDYTSAVNSKTSGTTDTTTANDELCLAAFNTGVISGESWSNSFSLEWRDSATPIFLLGSRVVSSTWTAETTLSWGGTARLAAGCISTFKGVVTSTWTPKVIMVN